MHPFPTTSLHTTSNQFTILAAQDNTDSNASAVCSKTSSLPPLSPISETSMHTATNDRARWVSQGIYALLAAISQLGTDTLQSSTTQDTNTTPDSLKGNTNWGVSVKLKNTGTNDIQEALRNLQFKCTCICKQQEQEEEEGEKKRANQTENKKQEQEELELYVYPGEGFVGKMGHMNGEKWMDCQLGVGKCTHIPDANYWHYILPKCMYCHKNNLKGISRVLR